MKKLYTENNYKTFNKNSAKKNGEGKYNIKNGKKVKENYYKEYQGSK